MGALVLVDSGGSILELWNSHAEGDTARRRGSIKTSPFTVTETI
jgi:hypothetical protein